MAENIKVACRVRPLNSSEQERHDKCIVQFPGDGKSAIGLGGKTFNFDHVIQPKASQLEVYETVAKPIVADVLSGYNGTIFAYGQTSSGKTFTMEGVLNDEQFQGIIPRIIRDIFDHIYQMDENLEFHIKVSYFEIYLDKIRDLLDVTKTNLAVHEDKDKVPYVKGATERFVSSPEDVFDAIHEGKSNRHVAVTNMNEHSSRSHSVFQITMRQENTETQKKLHGKLYLVDLAGSEKVAKTGAEGTVLDEAKNINKSLSALGNVINALVEQSPHIPYRDSKLTRILQESLGGNARTTMVICCSPAAYNEGETKSTLMFGMRAKTIKNCVTVNEELTAEEWRRRYEREKERVRRLQGVIGGLETEIEKWRNGDKIDKTEWFTKDHYYNAAGEENGDALSLPAPDVTTSLLLPASGSPASSGVPMTSPATGAARPSVLPSASCNEEQLQALYQQLDDKDDEINKQGQIIARLREQMDEQEESLRSARNEQESYCTENSKLQRECESVKEEVKEVLQALEELAVNFDQKEAELISRTEELERAQDNILKHDDLVLGKENENQRMKEQTVQLKKKYAEAIASLMRDLGELGESIGDPLSSKATPNSTDRLDEDLTVMRLHICRLKSDTKSIHNRIKELEEEKVQHMQLIKKSDEEVKHLRIRVQEYEVKMANLNDKVDDYEQRKRALQEQVDSLNAQVAVHVANEQVLGSSKQNEILAGQDAIQTKLDEELKRQSNNYTLQIKNLRDELAAKEKKLEESKDQINHLELLRQNTSEELAKTTATHEAMRGKLEKLEKMMERREQARKDLEDLESTVTSEMDALNTLRNVFMQELLERMKKSKSRVTAEKQPLKIEQLAGCDGTETANGSKETNDSALAKLLAEEEDEEGGSAHQRAKIHYLETNLMKLTRVHKSMVQSKAEMRNDLLRMEKRHKSTVERVQMLENSLKEAKDGAMRDRKRYNHEIERIREAMRQRTPYRSRPAAQIAKPIRAGHIPQPVAVSNPVSDSRHPLATE